MQLSTRTHSANTHIHNYTKRIHTFVDLHARTHNILFSFYLKELHLFDELIKFYFFSLKEHNLFNLLTCLIY